MNNDVWASTTSILARASDRAVHNEQDQRPAKYATKGYKLRDEAPRRNAKTLLTDAQVLECRSLYEFTRGWTHQKMAEKYGTSVRYMEALLQYRTRSKLIPKRPG